MEAVMTNELTQTNALADWWNNADFPGKEFCTLHENGDLALRKTDLHAERTIASLTLDNADAVLKALTEKFPEVEARGNELQHEWDAADDKLKLIGKVSRHREYLMHTNAIGDFDILFHQVDEWEKVLSSLISNNYTEKLALIEKAEKLVDSDNWKDTTNQLKEIGEEWKAIGFVDKQRNDDLWNRLEEARTKFFDRKRGHQEDQEKEMLQNLDLKMELVEKAESLAASENWKEATETFKQLMEQWKATGRTVHDKNEALWNRFIQAKNVFFERKRAHFEVIQAEQEANYILKLALAERAEALKDSTDWNKTAHAYADLMEEWKKIGRVPLDKADEVWERVSVAKEHFFKNKRQHQESLRVTQEDNYAQKLALAKRAEELKHSNQWREATEEMNELMNDWKKIGPVPREHINTIWEQFIAARKFFFERKDADREKRKQHIEKQFQFKQDRTSGFLQKLEAELREEQERLVDFQAALQNVTPGPKEEELRSHLTKLIGQTEGKIKSKEEKVKDIRQQLEELDTKKKPSEKKHQKDEPAAKHEEPVAQEQPAAESAQDPSAQEGASVADESAAQKEENSETEEQ
jgi:hypothetical protein